ncbi:MAG TPA: hypothetical protein VM324_04290 [Egibacteraceae bacterium]|nr:hypothetical protein [Egibacteraceae bacterium]
MAVVLGLLLVLAVGALPVFSLFVGHTTLGRATGEAVRFATKVETNPCVAGTPGCVFDQPGSGCPLDARRRPSVAEVEAYLRAAAGNPSLEVRVHDPADTNVQRQPCATGPGTVVAVTAAYDHNLGVLASLANTASRLVGNGPMFTGTTVRVVATAVGVEE